MVISWHPLFLPVPNQLSAQPASSGEIPSCWNNCLLQEPSRFGLHWVGLRICLTGIARQSALLDLGWSGPRLREPVSSATGLNGFIWALTSLHSLWSACLGPGPDLVSVLRLQMESPWGFIPAECSPCFSWSILQREARVIEN